MPKQTTVEIPVSEDSNGQLFLEIWIEKYQPIIGKSQNYDADDWRLETYDEDLKRVRDTPSEFVWTILEGDDDKIYLSAGYHFVNRMAYIITKNPHNYDKNCQDILY